MFNFFNKRPQGELFWKIDLHSHVCPGIDDGSPDIHKSIDLIRGMHELGFEGMVLTPHVAEEEFPNTRETIDTSYNSLREFFNEHGEDMKLGISAEYRIDSNFVDMLEKRILRPLPGGEYILVENAWFKEPIGLESILYELRQNLGFTPVLAHPERYAYYHSTPERFRELADKGVRMQVNILSLAGYYGKIVKRTAEDLVSAGLVSFLGSDLHRTTHLKAIRQYLNSSDYRKLLRQSPGIINDKVFAGHLT